MAVKQPVDNLILSKQRPSADTALRARWPRSRAIQHHGDNVMPGYTATQRVEELVGEECVLEGNVGGCERAVWERQIPMGRLATRANLRPWSRFSGRSGRPYTGASIPVDGGWIKPLL